ncbi:MAG: hypothetical protein FWD22_05305 [Treponema sp.]|nr:hypothetical protein [Treponema sp.]
MKKMIFVGLAVLMAFALISCDMVPIAILGGDEFVQYHLDDNGQLTAMTLTLDGGSASKNVSRALFDSMAKASYDYFEVVFYAQTGAAAGSREAVRTTWEFGASGVISGVHRTVAGVDYATADPAAVTAIDEGAAVLFIGNRTTMNLLAVGLLTHVDGVPNTEITTTSRTVTFTVHSLEAGLGFASVTAAAPLNIRLNLADATGVNFNGIALASGAPTTGNYSFGFSGLTPTTDEDEILARFAGIRVNEANPKILPRNPAFISAGKVISFYSTASILTTSEFTLAADAPLATTDDGAVAYTFNTPAEIGWTAFTYDIPVYAITKDVGADDSVFFPWRIRPGQGVNAGYLDNNTPTALGGSILLSIGAAPATINLEQDVILITN